MRLNIAGRIARRTELDIETGCWVWQGPVGTDGYASLWVNEYKRSITLQRAAYFARHGSIPEGLQIDHLCRNKRCANPDHLEAVTLQENTRRARAMKTHCVNGHLYTEENLSYFLRGDKRYRHCRICRNARDRELRRKRRT